MRKNERKRGIRRNSYRERRLVKEKDPKDRKCLPGVLSLLRQETKLK